MQEKNQKKRKKRKSGNSNHTVKKKSKSRTTNFSCVEQSRNDKLQPNSIQEILKRIAELEKKYSELENKNNELCKEVQFLKQQMNQDSKSNHKALAEITKQYSDMEKNLSRLLQSLNQSNLNNKEHQSSTINTLQNSQKQIATGGSIQQASLQNQPSSQSGNPLIANILDELRRLQDSLKILQEAQNEFNKTTDRKLKTIDKKTCKHVNHLEERTKESISDYSIGILAHLNRSISKFNSKLNDLETQTNALSSKVSNIDDSQNKFNQENRELSLITAQHMGLISDHIAALEKDLRELSTKLQQLNARFNLQAPSLGSLSLFSPLNSAHEGPIPFSGGLPPPST